MRKFYGIAVYLIFILTAQLCLACKEVALNESFPIKKFDLYDTIVLVTITKAPKNTESRYGGFLYFTGVVQEALKGSLSKGVAISGQPANESPKAVCPTNLTVGSTYLLLLNQQGNSYNLSRFSFPTNSKHVYYSKYVQEIKTGVKGS